ncbi:hypothetical protein CCP3SC15_1500011 [Gammaproteobacteria bacterium]
MSTNITPPWRRTNRNPEWKPKTQGGQLARQLAERDQRREINRLLRLAQQHPYAFRLPAERLQGILSAIHRESRDGVPTIAEIMGAEYTDEFQFQMAQLKTDEHVDFQEHERINDRYGYDRRRKIGHANILQAIETAKTWSDEQNQNP